MSFLQKIQYVKDEKLSMVLTQFVVLLYIVTQLTFMLQIFKCMILQTTNQLQLFLENFKVIVNSFNEAIISKTENGTIGYCNKHGLNLISAIIKCNES